MVSGRSLMWVVSYVCFECVVVEPDGADDCWLAPVVVDGEEDVVVEHTLDVFDDCCRVTVVC